MHVFCKGAGEAVSAVVNGKHEWLDTADIAGDGLRVLAIAHKTIKNIGSREEVESNLEFRGLVGLYDPPRIETFEAVKRCQIAGI